MNRRLSPVRLALVCGVRQSQVRVTFLELPFPLTAHWCCDIRGGPVDAASRGPVDPRRRTVHRGGARRAAGPDARRRTPPPRPAGRGRRGGGARAARPGAPRPRTPGEGVRAHRAWARGLRPAVRRPRGPGAPVPARDRRRGGRQGLRAPARGVHRGPVRGGRDGPPRAEPGRGARERPHRRGLRRRRARRCRWPGEQLCQQHCPVSHVAHEFPQLCEAETEAIGRVLGRHVQRLATIAHGDGVCTTCIPDLPTTEKEKVTS